MSVSLRAARRDDCARVWQWNFASDVRALSGDPRLVELDEHAAWFAARLARAATSPMWIVEDTGVPVGVVRVDRLADGAGRLSVALAPSARGRGIGKASITAACARWHGPVVAQIHADNTASRACFESCGFEPVGRAGELFIYERTVASRFPPAASDGNNERTIMEPSTQQLALWQSEFGRAYTDRNDRDNPARVDSLARILAGIAPQRTLEVGCNVGWNLTYLRRLGFTGLHGIEPQPYAVARARARIGEDPEIGIETGTAFALPFTDASFDLAFTSGVLIHISPRELGRALDEIYRVSRRWIVGIEYDKADGEVEIEYRGHAGALWKRDHGSAWRLRHPDLVHVRTIELHAGDGYDDCTAHVFEKHRPAGES